MSADMPGPERGDRPSGPPPNRACFPEPTIERVAKVLVRRGWTETQGVDGLFLPAPPGRGPELDSDALRLLGHARECFRCRDVLHLFAVVEEDFRRSFAVVEEHPGRLPEESSALLLEVAGVAAAAHVGTPARVIELHPRNHRSRRRLPADADETPELEYALAAATPGDEPPPEPAWETRVLTLSSFDDRFLVRIFPNESGEGATAVLVNEEAPVEGSGVRPRPFLRAGGVEYPFDVQDVARLAAFPVEGIELVYRVG